jgi:hypothetical protein
LGAGQWGLASAGEGAQGCGGAGPWAVAELPAGGAENRGGRIGRWEEGERGGADRWGRAASERKERARAEGELGQGTAHAVERRERVRWASGEKGER